MLTLPRATAALSWSALAEQSRSCRSAAVARCSAFCRACGVGYGHGEVGAGRPRVSPLRDLRCGGRGGAGLGRVLGRGGGRAGVGVGRMRGLTHLQESLRLWISLPRSAAAADAAAVATAAAASAAAAAAATAAAATGTAATFQRRRAACELRRWRRQQAARRRRPLLTPIAASALAPRT